MSDDETSGASPGGRKPEGPTDEGTPESPMDDRNPEEPTGSDRLRELIRSLRRPGAYPHPVDEVEVLHTHVSVVFLAGDFAYKVKKPVDLGFLDFTTLERRRHFCEEEVRLNRRLAPDVYLGVAPIVEAAEGTGTSSSADGPDAPGTSPSNDIPDYRVLGEDGADRAGARSEGHGAGRHEDGPGECGPGHGGLDGAGPDLEPVEYAVKMRRLPADATLLEHLKRGDLTPDMVDRVADRIADFHGKVAGGPEAASYGRWRVVARNALENLRQTRDHVGRTVSRPVYDRVRAATEEALRSHQELIEDRSRRGVPRDTHGDLHLDHVYLLPDRTPPDDLVVIDCIEFNRRFRYADPVADMAFLAMDLAYRGRRDLARRLVDRYFEAREDPEGRSLLPSYVSYRALVRAKVRGIAAEESSVPLEEQRNAVRDARGYWLLALGELVVPDERPGLVLVGGLPGTGKSTLARRLGEAADFEVISSDRQRKRLAGLDEEDSAEASFGEGIYTPEWTRRTYAACLRTAAGELCRGRRVIVDATFRDDGWRNRFMETARRLGVRHAFLVTTCDPDAVRERIRERGPDPSDADWEIHQKVAERWETPSGEVARRTVEVDTGTTVDEAVARGLEALHGIGLVRTTPED